MLAPPPLDYEYAINRIVQFLRDFLKKTGANGYVMGLSGGVDSSTALVLAVRAVGSDKVKALIMPDPEVTPEQDVEDAKELAEKFSVEYVVIDISKIRKGFEEAMPFYDHAHNLAVGNLRARIRMCILYYYANRFNYIVLGASDKSELLLGYFTKYGDGGVDVLPLGDVYKTQVRVMARMLGVPEKIVTKPSSPHLWPGQLAEEELGARYEEIDAVLYRYVDLGMDIDAIVRDTGLPREKVLTIIRRVHLNEHKRLFPLIPKVSKYALTHDWRMPWYLRT